MDASNSDEYFVTALQIFDFCGADSSGTLRVDALMDKIAPFVKTNNSEFSYLRSLLDSDLDNHEINVNRLAVALNKYSENQKAKVDHDESFNLNSGQAPQDSDSGISTDGFQLLEELQCELREKARLAAQLRGQLEQCDRHHEEALAALAADADQLRVHLNLLREENATLSEVRRDYEETCERLSVCEVALSASRRELDSYKKRSKVLHEQVSTLENEKLTLQEQLSKSREECHRINEMYASRQAALLEQDDTLRAEHAELSARLRDHDHFMQQLIKEKVLLEMELKELLNKSNHAAHARSVDVSYTEDQMLSALDSLNADPRFSQENRLLDEESFVNALREDQGRATNMSLFDEIRLSFCNMSRHNQTDNNLTFDKLNRSFDTSLTNTGTQTDEEICDCNKYNGENNTMSAQTEIDINLKKYDVSNVKETSKMDISTQTKDVRTYSKDKYCQCLISNKVTTTSSQTDDNNNNDLDIKCMEYEKLKKHTQNIEREAKRYMRTISSLETDLEKCEDNLDLLHKAVVEGEDENGLLKDAIKGLKDKLCILEETCDGQLSKIDRLCGDTCSTESQTEFDTASAGVQVEIPCSDCVKRNVAPQKSYRRYLWEPIKGLFQIFAVVCFVCAVSVLYGVSRRRQVGCGREPVPWQWLGAQDLMDLLLRIEYVADVPM